MFGLFRKRDKYPTLTDADRLIIAEQSRSTDVWLKLYRDSQNYGYGPEKAAYAKAACDEARIRMNAADAAYDAMMKRLTAEAASLIQAAKES